MRLIGIPLYEGDLSNRYPSIYDSVVLEMVSVSHFNLNRVKELVSKRPELARATWDWAFGDWETALGAASHIHCESNELLMTRNRLGSSENEDNQYGVP